MQDIKLPKRDPEGHKGTFGSVVVIGGHANNSTMSIGGAVLAASAALRSGCGVARLCLPESILGLGLSMLPEATGIVQPKDGRWPDVVRAAGAVVIGPGLGLGDVQRRILEEALRLSIPTIIDADAITLIAENSSLSELVHEQCVLTPHPKEYERLALSFGLQPVHVHQGNNIPASLQLSEKLGCCVVLKNAETVVSYEGSHWEFSEPNPVLATGGSGDVLSGIISGLLAQFTGNNQLSIEECARVAVVLHSRAGSEWAHSTHANAGMLLHELLGFIPQEVEKLRTD